MYILEITLHSWNLACKDLVIPRIEKRLAEELPMVEVKINYTEEETIPVFKGLHDGAIMFEIKWLCTSVDIVERFKERIK